MLSNLSRWQNRKTSTFGNRLAHLMERPIGTNPKSPAVGQQVHQPGNDPARPANQAMVTPFGPHQDVVSVDVPTHAQGGDQEDGSFKA